VLIDDYNEDYDNYDYCDGYPCKYEYIHDYYYDNDDDNYSPDQMAIYCFCEHIHVASVDIVIRQLVPVFCES